MCISPFFNYFATSFRYFVGKNLVEIPRLCVLIFCLTAGLYPQIEILCPFGYTFEMALFAAWHVAGWAQFFSITFDDKSAQLMLVIFCLIGLQYGGIYVRLAELSFLEYSLTWLSPARWLAEDLYMCHSYELSGVFRIPPQWLGDTKDSVLGAIVSLSFAEPWVRLDSVSANPYTDELNPVQWNVLLNFWMGFLIRCVSLFSLVYSNRVQMSQPPLLESLQNYFPRLGICRSYILSWTSKQPATQKETRGHQSHGGAKTQRSTPPETPEPEPELGDLFGGKNPMALQSTDV